MLKRSRRGEKNIQKNCIKKDLNELDYWDGVVGHPEPDTLECEVKWAFLRSTAVNKVSGCDEIPAELFKFLKEEANKVLHSLCLHIWKTEQWPQDWKRLILIPIPKKGSTKECANHQFYWSPMLVRSYLKSCARLQHYVNQELPDVQAEFRKERGTRDQIVNICWIIEKAREFQKIIYLCFINYAKSFDCVQFSRSVMFDSLRPHGLQHARLPCPSPAPGACPNSCPLSWWCHPTILSFVIPFSWLQSFPASGYFPVSQFFASGGQSIGSFSFSISPSNEYSGLISFRMDWFDWSSCGSRELFGCVDHDKLWKALRLKYQTILHISWRTNMWSRSNN